MNLNKYVIKSIMRFTHTLTVIMLLISLLFLSSYFITRSAINELDIYSPNSPIEKEILSQSMTFLGLVSPSLFFIKALSVEEMSGFFFNFSLVFIFVSLLLIGLNYAVDRKLRSLLNLFNYSSWIAAGIMVFYAFFVKLIFGPSAIANVSKELYLPTIELLIENAFRTYIFFGAFLLILSLMITGYLRSTRDRDYVLKANKLEDVGRKFNF